jgi:hypothetical protein
MRKWTEDDEPEVCPLEFLMRVDVAAERPLKLLGGHTSEEVKTTTVARVLGGSRPVERRVFRQKVPVEVARLFEHKRSAQILQIAAQVLSLGARDLCKWLGRAEGLKLHRFGRAERAACATGRLNFEARSRIAFSTAATVSCAVRSRRNFTGAASRLGFANQRLSEP